MLCPTKFNIASRSLSEEIKLCCTKIAVEKADARILVTKTSENFIWDLLKEKQLANVGGIALAQVVGALI